MKLKPRVPGRIARAIVPGARVKVLEGPKKTSGKLVAETKNMLVIEEDSGKIIKLPKKQVVIMVNEKFVVPGSALVGDPAERLVKAYER